jgi:hypothetical protein
MLCPRCHGTHVIVVNGQRRPCPDCQGMGEIHCCDGLQEQPDPEQVCGIRGQESEVRNQTENRSPSD